MLGKPAINSLNIVTLTEPNNYFCGKINSDTPKATRVPAETSEIINKFSEVFQGLGKVKGEPIHIKMKENTAPYCLTAPRHIHIPMVKNRGKGNDTHGTVRNNKESRLTHKMVPPRL